MRRLAAIALLVIGVAGCGKIAEPQPPFIRIPEPVRDFHAVQAGNDIVLSWTNSPHYIDGSTATDLETVHILRAGSKLADLKSAGAGQSQSHVLSATDFIGTMQSFTLWLETARHLVSTRVETSVSPAEVPGVVGGAQAVVDQYMLTVHWSTPAVNGSLVDHYVVVRQDQPAKPLTTPSLQVEDETYEAGKTYSYTITPVRRVNGGDVAGVPSAPLAVVAKDVTPPKAPAGLQLEVAPAGALLAWSASEERDLAGYRVYRSDRPETFTLRTANSFFDPDYRPGLTYAVSAIDEFGNESPRTRSEFW